ncbi:type II secretion system protein [Cryobacterium frigoriphilum]|uniref:Type II secretion system protein n=1 Tax=Cryobacterium frigoriphilum TaxID=1259150 RepID=A0A4R9A4G9_9MICO|nr:type II secretion system protein [Cryobacterium frigoriphilum]TFD52046.1 type II secretion system protein [Cryobacterium frigoriphilum]
MQKTETTESGFGLIEIVVSMFLLGLLAVAFLPLIVQSMQVSVVNASIATATQLVSEQIEQARAQGTVCSALPASDSATSSIDSTLTVQRVRGVCPAAPAGYPGVVTFRVSVVQAGSSTPLAEASTLIFVSAP